MWFSGGREPRSYRLGCHSNRSPGVCTREGYRDLAANGSAENLGRRGRKFSSCLGFCSFFRIKSDGYLGEGFILDIGPLKSFSFPPALALKDFLFPCLFPKAFPFPCFPITEGRKKKVPKPKPTTTN